MGKNILFSPVGGTDPMSENNYKDGSMIHITRVYKADEVILYMSKEMLEKQEQDSRYTYCIEELGKIQQREIKYHIIKRENLQKVQEYNYFYEDFGVILMDIMKKMDKTDRLLLNVSSGTPAMKSALIVLQHLWEANCISVQVSTPKRAMNTHIHSSVEEYDIKTRWELNEDNEENFENRCVEVQCTSLINIKKSEILKKLVEEYDYEAALLISKNINQCDENVITMLEIANHRLLLDFSSMNKKLNALQNEEFKNITTPVKDSKYMKYFEYILSLDVKLKKAQYGDFIRAISPVIKDLFILIIEKELKIDVLTQLCQKVVIKDQEIYKWSKSKLSENKKVQSVLEEQYQGFNYDSPVYSSHLETIVEYLVQDKNVRDTVHLLRKVEEKVRNIASHEIISITQDYVLSNTGATPTKIIEELKKALGYAGSNIQKNKYNSYDLMNKEITNKISKFYKINI